MPHNRFESSSGSSVAEIDILEPTPARDADTAKDGMMEILLPPSLDPNLNGDLQPRFFSIPDGIVRAEEQFHELLPSLLKTDRGNWVYVTASGSHRPFGSQDDAELAAEEAQIPGDQFVVRLVSHFE